MPTRAAVGRSTSHSAREAGREAVASALDRLRADARLVLLFATTGYDQAELLEGVVDVAGATPISGCSAEGVIAQHVSDEGAYSVVAMAIASQGATFAPLLATGLARGPRDCGVALAEQVRAHAAKTGRRASILLLFPDGISGNSADLLAALQESLPYPLVIVGGAAGANIATLRTTYQYHEGRAVSDAVAGVLIGGDVVLDTVVSHGSTPIGVARTVTKSDGGTVYEIDGHPAWHVFKEYLEGSTDDLRPSDSISLAFAERLPPELARPEDEYVMHTPFGFDKESGALFFPGGLRQGAKIQIARRDPDRIRDGATASARVLAERGKGRVPSLVLHFDCAGRGRIIFGERATAATVSSIQHALGHHIPWMGFYTYGEIAPRNEQSFCHNHTVVLCALYDAETTIPPPRPSWTRGS